MITAYLGYLVMTMGAYLISHWVIVASVIVYLMWTKAVWDELHEDFPGFDGTIIILFSPVLIFVGWGLMAYDAYCVKTGRRLWR